MRAIAPRETLDRHIKELLDDVLIMGSMVETAIAESVDALERRDLKAARRICDNDQLINEKHYAIENDVLTLIATQQPMARDLRILAAVLEVVIELERIGDYAKGIGRINLMMGDQPLMVQFNDIRRMSQLGLDMLHRALGAFIARDAETARAIPKEDDAVDDLFNRFYHDLLARMIADPTTIDNSNYLQWVAHNLERMADRVTNICERIVFVVTGEIIEMDQSDDEHRQRDNQ